MSSSGSFLKYAITTKEDLRKSYMPYVKGGGIFIPTDKKLVLGDEVFIMLSLMDEKDKPYPVAGKVVWMNTSISKDKPIGVGVQFSSGTDADALKNRIEILLVGVKEDIPSYTM